MISVFGSAAAGGGIYSNPLVILLGVLLITYIFIKFCSWAKGNKLSGGIKKIIFLLTGLGMIAFNVLYSMGNAAIDNLNDWNMATYALIGSVIWVFIFAYALMTEKAE